jgi:hypothetical protein
MRKASLQPLSPFLDERERQIDDDYEWCLHDPDAQHEYSGRVVVVHKRRIWGAGKNHREAWNAARRKRGCPSRGLVAFVVIP